MMNIKLQNFNDSLIHLSTNYPSINVGLLVVLICLYEGEKSIPSVVERVGGVRQTIYDRFEKLSEMKFICKIKRKTRNPQKYRLSVKGKRYVMGILSTVNCD